ncbi:MAG: ribonuclease HI family protein [Candidatus Alcyoniella australis]|nr:ribonuclease HI family protein [Candidatus Alcyoniella australis]
MDTLYANFDGASRGNPGPASAGAVLYDGTGRVLARAGKYLGENTNNYAEYNGLLLALKLAREHGVRRLVIRADSQLIVRQIEGRYKVKAANLIPLYQRARELMAHFERVRVEHGPREKNSEADRLANLAIDEHFAKR